MLLSVCVRKKAGRYAKASFKRVIMWAKGFGKLGPDLHVFMKRNVFMI